MKMSQKIMLNKILEENEAEVVPEETSNDLENNESVSE